MAGWDIPGRPAGIRVGMGDDAAVWRPKANSEVILTCDWFLEGTHFRQDIHPPECVGWKCLARAVSDVAAMGATPRCFLMSLALPKTAAGNWLDRFLRGVHDAASKFGCVLAGGDTTRRDEILINLTVIGEMKAGSAGLRKGAKPGDKIYVSGRLGEAELGWRLAKNRKAQPSAKTTRRDSLFAKHFYPEPRIHLGQWLVQNHLASTMMDLSDGLSSDLARLCDASRVGARVEAAKLPLASGAFLKKFKASELQEAALHGGDDYELLFCVDKRYAPTIPSEWHGIPLTEIGEIAKKSPIQLVEESGLTRMLRPQGWDPFRR